MRLLKTGSLLLAAWLLAAGLLSLPTAARARGASPSKPLRVTYILHAPLDRGFVTSGIGYQEIEKHDGVDYKHETNFDVFAIGFGYVAAVKECTEFRETNCVYLRGRGTAESNYGYGHLIVIEHPYSTLPSLVVEATGVQPGQSLFVLYSHLENVPEVSEGDWLAPGDQVGILGRSGNTYGNATYHLHMEIRIAASGSLESWRASPWLGYDWFKMTPIDPKRIEPFYGENLWKLERLTRDWFS